MTFAERQDSAPPSPKDQEDLLRTRRLEEWFGDKQPYAKSVQEESRMASQRTNDQEEHVSQPERARSQVEGDINSQPETHGTTAAVWLRLMVGG